jgi:hypothetical protein
MSERRFVKEIDIETAGEFLDKLSPRGPYFGEESDTGTWIFRGHSNCDYPLLPKVLRLPDKLNPEPVYLKGQSTIWYPVDECRCTQVLVEYELRTLIAFTEVADENGLPLPNDSVEARRNLDDLLSSLLDVFLDRSTASETILWPPPEIL